MRSYQIETGGVYAARVNNKRVEVIVREIKITCMAGGFVYYVESLSPTAKRKHLKFKSCRRFRTVVRTAAQQKKYEAEEKRKNDELIEAVRRHNAERDKTHYFSFGEYVRVDS